MQLPHVGDAGMGVHRASDAHTSVAKLRALAARLRRVRVACGDFERVLGPSVTIKHGTTAVFLDPPYDLTKRASVYAVETDAAHRAREWAIANGDNPLLRIAYCGYGVEMPDTWTCIQWKAVGGYGSQGEGRGRENASKEEIWFSPFCMNETPLERWMHEQEASA